MRLRMSALLMFLCWLCCVAALAWQGVPAALFVMFVVGLSWHGGGMLAMEVLEDVVARRKEGSDA